jgi:tetratricopeptide (TPR) repeat protein
MSASKIFYILRALGYLAFIFASSSFASSPEHTNDVEIYEIIERERSIDEMLDRAEFIIHTNLDEVAALLFKISNTPKPLDQLQRHRLMLLQANQLILETEFEQADDILAQLMRQQPNTSTMIRVIYFRAHIADILENYEQAFAYLYRLDQYPRLSVSRHQQFEMLALATNLYIKAHAFSLANGYAQRALSLARQGQSPQLMCYALRSMTNVHIASKDFERAKIIADQAIEFCNDANEPIALAGSFINLSYWYREQQDYIQQRDYISQAIALYQQQHFIVSINSSKLLLADAFLLEDDVDNADKIMSKIFNEVEQLNVLDDLMLAYRIKAILYENSGDSALAMKYLKKFLSAKADVNDVSSKVHGAYLQMRFDNKINQQSVVISDIEHKNIELVTRIEELTTFLIVASSLLVLSITFYCFTFYRRGKTILMT